MASADARAARSENPLSSHGVLGPYQMHISIEPPREARPGGILVPPLAISVRVREAFQGSGDRGEDLNSYWASVSVVSEDGMVALAPPSTSLLSGTLVDSVRETALEQEENESEIGFFLFQNLRIHEPGNFRLRVSLLHMPTSGSETPSQNNGPSLSSGVKNAGSVVTRGIYVHADAAEPQIGQSTFTFRAQVLSSSYSEHRTRRKKYFDGVAEAKW